MPRAAEGNEMNSGHNDNTADSITTHQIKSFGVGRGVFCFGAIYLSSRPIPPRSGYWTWCRDVKGKFPPLTKSAAEVTPNFEPVV